MRNTVRLPIGSPLADKLIYRSVAFECFHFGTYTSYATIRRKQRTAKIGCRSKIYFLCKDGRLQVGRYQLKHNHEVNPENPASEIKIPDGKSRKRRTTSANYNVKSERILPDRYLEGYDLVVDPENTDFSRLANYSRWMDASGVDLYPSLSTEALIDSSHVMDHTCAEALLSHLDRSLSNLKSIAASGGTGRLLSCLKDLQELENKWKQETDLEDDAMEVPLGVAVDDLPVEGFEEAAPTRRSAEFTPLRCVDSQEFPPSKFPQPSNLESPDDDDSGCAWYHGERVIGS